MPYAPRHGAVSKGGPLAVSRGNVALQVAEFVLLFATRKAYGASASPAKPWPISECDPLSERCDPPPAVRNGSTGSPTPLSSLDLHGSIRVKQWAVALRPARAAVPGCLSAVLPGPACMLAGRQVLALKTEGARLGPLALLAVLTVDAGGEIQI
jgi:hypothetical protein